MSVKVDDLAAVLAKELAAYDQEVSNGIKAAVKDAAKIAVKTVRKASPTRTGDYKKGWTKKNAYEDSRTIRIRIHNKDEYQLTHLLENGHDIKRHGVVIGHAPAYPHISKAEQAAEEALDHKVKVVIG